MKTFDINKVKYVLAKEAIKHYPNHFIGCKKTHSNVLKKHKITENDYIYVTGIKNIKESKNKKLTSKNRLAVTKKWLDNLVRTQIVKYENVPQELVLSKKEKFHDNEDNVYDVEIRGERHYQKCYFKAKDIGKIFNIKDVQSLLTRERSSFIENKDYRIFMETTPTTVRNGLITKRVMKQLYLTYQGVWRLMFVSRNKVAEKFIDWAMKTLFTIQMGSNEEKVELVRKQLGIDVKEFARLTNVTKNISCIYLLLFGKVDELGDSFKLEDYNKGDYVCKYGLSNDMTRRITEHRKDYGKLGIDNIEMLYFIPIDEGLLDNAEKELRESFKVFNYNEDIEDVNGKIRKELVVLDNKTLGKMKKLYNKIGDHFGSRAISKSVEVLRQNEQVHKDLQMARIRIRELEENIKRERERINRLEKKNDRLEGKNDKLEDKKDMLEEKLRELLMDIKIK